MRINDKIEKHTYKQQLLGYIKGQTEPPDRNHYTKPTAGDRGGWTWYKITDWGKRSCTRHTISRWQGE